jgi:hypothetical protein
MTGHEPLLRMRRAGKRPQCVMVYDDDATICVQAAAQWHEQPNPYAQRFFACIRMTREDIPETLDLRCVVGLEVHLDCQRSESRAKRVFDALVKAGAAAVVSVQGNDVWLHRRAHG